MPNIRLNIGANGGSGNTPTPVLSTVRGGTQANFEVYNSMTVPAGCQWVEIYNAGDLGTATGANTGQVNGSDWSVGRRQKFEKTFDRTTNEEINLPAYNIVANGSQFQVSYLL